MSGLLASHPALITRSHTFSTPRRSWAFFFESLLDMQWPRLNFSLRHLVIVVAILSLPIAYVSNLKRNGERRAYAAKILYEMGVDTVVTGSTVELEKCYFSSGDELIEAQLPKVKHAQNGKGSLGSKLFGEQSFRDYSALIVRKPISGDAERFLDSLAVLKNARTIFHFGGTVDDRVRERIRKLDRSIKLHEIDAPVDLLP